MAIVLCVIAIPVVISAMVVATLSVGRRNGSLDAHPEPDQRQHHYDMDALRPVFDPTKSAYRPGGSRQPKAVWFIGPVGVDADEAASGPPPSGTTLLDQELADALSGVEIDTSEAAGVVYHLWRDKPVDELAWDGERGSLIITAGGVRAALAITDTLRGHEVQFMFRLEPTRVNAFGKPGHGLVLLLTSTTQEAILAPVSVVLLSGPGA